MARYRSPGRPLKSTKPKKDERLYLEDVDYLWFARKPGESIADVVHRLLERQRALEARVYDLTHHVSEQETASEVS